MKRKLGLFSLLIALCFIITACSVNSKPKQIAKDDLVGNTFKLVQVEKEADKNLMAKTLAEGNMEVFITFEKDGMMTYEVRLQEKFEKDKKANQILTMFNTLYKGLSDKTKWLFEDDVLEIQTEDLKATFKGTLTGKKLELVLQDGESPFGSGTIYLEKQ